MSLKKIATLTVLTFDQSPPTLGTSDLLNVSTLPKINEPRISTRSWNLLSVVFNAIATLEDEEREKRNETGKQRLIIVNFHGTTVAQKPSANVTVRTLPDCALPPAFPLPESPHILCLKARKKLGRRLLFPCPACGAEARLEESSRAALRGAGLAGSFRKPRRERATRQGQRGVPEGERSSAAGLDNTEAFPQLRKEKLSLRWQERSLPSALMRISSHSYSMILQTEQIIYEQNEMKMHPGVL
ncbi:uncharacterized protein LOC110407507 [Numida meleagris]|uniref:uncharacterized protein LOC110407507 n=1 Tax=Numida meleagris TaxID=8996 RepID=UPI000B3DDCBF|nr:uncharacterized protein LOC110407507 [Numida meleagris]